MRLRPISRRFPRALTVAVALFLLSAMLTSLAWDGSASARPSLAGRDRADLAVGVRSEPTELPPAGGRVQVAVTVHNLGTASADGVTVKLRPPAGATVAGDGSAGWSCDLGMLKCDAGTLPAGAEAAPLTLPFNLPAQDVGTVVTVSATASTSSLESATENNTGKATVAYTAVADLSMELLFAQTEVSNLGGRSFVQARVTNLGTAPAADVRVVMDPPPGGHVQLSNFVTDEWQCDVTGAPWVCTRGALAPEAIAALNIPLLFDPGTAGDTMCMTATASTTTAERSLDNNQAATTFRYIVPAPADLVMLGMDATPPQVVAGDQVTLLINVDNIGGSPADNVVVRIPLPDTVQPVSSEASEPDWSCTVVTDDSGQRFWDCARPRFLAESLELVGPIQLVVALGAGTPEGTLTFTATVRTDSPEQSTDNNLIQASTTYVPQGFISGRVWLDQDRDGQRDIGEPAVGSGGEGVRLLQMLKEGQSEPSFDTPAAFVGSDGTYVHALAPGRYYVRVNVNVALDFTTPNSGDDATDSDVTFKARANDGVTAESAVVDVVDGHHTVIDIGLVTV